MEEGKGHKQYSAEYLRKYLDGELSGPEMQALEKAALEDPFLSDALEGLEASGDIQGYFNFRCNGFATATGRTHQNKKQKRNSFQVTRMAGCRGRFFHHRSSHHNVYLNL